MKKLLALVLVVVMLVSVVACTKPSNPDNEKETGGNKVVYQDIVEGLDYDAASEKLYDTILGDFYTAYEAAKAATNVSERQALMAIAEAKLMSAAVMLPLTTQGGMYAISRVAPNTSTSTLWGNDVDRYHDVIVCTQPIKSADRAEMKAKWNELKGTGTYEAWAKEFLTGKGYTIKNTYSIAYSSDPKTWDALATSRAADSEAIVNTYDGLFEYDMENVFKPALAESYTVSEDGLTYTFKIRQGVKWVDVQGIIVKADEYIKGTVTDFAEVGVKATDDYTLVYTLEAPCSYFTTMLAYNVFAPMNRAFYESKGGKFGAEYSAEAEGYTYGQTPADIAYCGPYTVSNFTAENKIVFSANAKYWDANGINVTTIEWLFNDGKDATKAYNDMKAGTIDGCSLNPSSLELARKEKVDGNTTWYDAYYYVSSTNAVSYMAFYNVNRAMFTNFNDTTKAASTLSELDHTRATAAMRNVHFRRAISFATDRAAYNAQTNGEELKLNSLRNCYTPGNFVSLTEEVTVQINGTAKTYPAGTWYGQIMQDQLNADGVKIKVWDPTADGGVGSSDGFDGWYNAANAVEELNLAITELAAQGIEISAANPIKFEVPYYSGSTSYANRAQAYKQSIETALGGKVQVVLVDCPTADEWYYAGYYADTGDQANYDMYDVSGWGPDYGDPQTYLDTFLPDYAGYMVKCLGIF